MQSVKEDKRHPMIKELWSLDITKSKAPGDVLFSDSRTLYNNCHYAQTGLLLCRYDSKQWHPAALTEQKNRRQKNI